jgi:hypothetical protein
MDAVFHMHHFAHAQNDLVTGNSIGGVRWQVGWRRRTKAGLGQG